MAVVEVRRQRLLYLSEYYRCGQSSRCFTVDIQELIEEVVPQVRLPKSAKNRMKEGMSSDLSYTALHCGKMYQIMEQCTEHACIPPPCCKAGHSAMI